MVVSKKDRLLFTASLNIPVLLTLRIPDRAPPSLALPTDNKILVNINMKKGNRKALIIKPYPGLLVKEFVNEVYEYLLEEVMPEQIPLLITWEGAKEYRLGLSVVLTYTLVKGLEALYEESFEAEDLIGIISSLLMERGIGRVESEALARAIVKNSIALTSFTGEIVEHKKEPIKMSFTKTVKLVSKHSSIPDSDILDLLAKTSSYILFNIMRYLTINVKSPSDSASLDIITNIYNSLWGSLYNFTRTRRPGTQQFILAPSLPGELTYTKISW